MKRISISVPDDLAAHLQEAADADHRSLSSLVAVRLAEDAARRTPPMTGHLESAGQGPKVVSPIGRRKATVTPIPKGSGR